MRFFVFIVLFFVSTNIYAIGGGGIDNPFDGGSISGETTFEDNVILDDDSGDSPSLILKDGDDKTLTITKLDTGNATITNNEGDIVYSAIGGDHDFSDNNISNVADIALDTISSDDNTAINVTLGTDAGDDFIVDTSKLVIEGDSGNVGIGTIAPIHSLHIYNDITPTIKIQAHAATDESIIFNRSDNSQSWVVGRDNTYNNLAIDYAADNVGAISATPLFNIQTDGNIGIGEIAPETDLEITSTAPYVTLHNSTAEDIDGGREGIIQFFGEQSGGEETTLVKIQASHDGTGDDEKADLIFYTNDGNDGTSPTERMRIDSSGNVGIGIAPTSARLEVSSAGTSNICILRNSSDTANDTVSLLFAVDTASGTIGSKIVHKRTNTADRGELQFWTKDTALAGDNTSKRMTITAFGSVGIGEPSPESFLELSYGAPYITLHNTAEEDIDGGRESRLIFKGEQSGGEETTLAKIQASHDGTGDDEKGDLIFYTNDGSDGTSPTERMRIDSNGYIVRSNVTSLVNSSSLADDAEEALPTDVGGHLIIWVEGDDEFADCLIQDDGTVIILSSNGSVVNTDSDTNLCIYDAGTGASIKNRLGATKTIVYEFLYK